MNSLIWRIIGATTGERSCLILRTVASVAIAVVLMDKGGFL
jgi:hypothetical protein